ncbi:MAG: glycosyltransferase [Opitutales bacterium]|nr:glycosyltransferase [Opitutales bacterium]
MKVFCCYTPAHEVLLNDYFIPSLPNDVSLTAFPLKEIQGNGDFLSKEFIQCINQKIDLIIDSLDQLEDTVIVWSDIDILCFKSFKLELESFIWGKNLDIAFQKEGFGKWDKEVNTGFIAMRSNDRVRNFYKRVREAMNANPDLNEQPVINQLLQEEDLDLNWAMLPNHFATRSLKWPPDPDLTLYHANATEGTGAIQQKIQQFEELQAYQPHQKVKVCVVSPEMIGPRRNSGIGTHTHHLVRHLTTFPDTAVTLLLTAEIAIGEADHWRKHFKETYGVDIVFLEHEPPMYPIVGWFNQWFNLRSQQVYQFLARNNHDIVYFQDLNGDGFVSHQARNTGLAFSKTVFTTMINGPARWAREGMKCFTENEVDESLLEFIESYPVSHTDIVSAPSNYAFEYIEHDAGWKMTSERRTCPYMLDIGSANERSTSNTTGQPHPRIVFFGRLETRKGIHLFLAALDLLAKENYFGQQVPEIIFIGNHSETPSGSSKEVIPEFFRQHLSSWTYTIHSEWDQPECIEYLSENRDSLVVLPSIAETLGYTAIECFALGIQTIGSNSGAFPEIFESPDHLFELNPRAIAAKIKDAYNGDLPLAKGRYRTEAAKEAWTALHEDCLKLLEQKKRSLPQQLAKRPLVSICIPYYNYGNYFPEQMLSLARQSYPNYEVIVINDGSTDPESIQVFEKFKARFGDQSRFRFFSQDNQGLSATRNRAAELAKGDLIVFCDADNISHYHMTEVLAEAIFSAEADCVTCHFDKFKTDAEGRRIQLDFYTPLGAAIEAGPYVDPFGDANFIIRKEVFQQLGGFRHVPFTASEDWEFLAELVLSGYKLEVVPRSLFQYREHESSNMRVTNFFDSRMRTLEPYLKRCPQPWMRALLLHSVGVWENRQRASREAAKRYKEVPKTSPEPWWKALYNRFRRATCL